MVPDQNKAIIISYNVLFYEILIAHHALLIVLRMFFFNSINGLVNKLFRIIFVLVSVCFIKNILIYFSC